MTMSDYIKREDAIKAIKSIDDHDNVFRANALGLAERAVQIIPAANVVKVVRCRDCRYWEKDGDNSIGFSMICQSIRQANDFCSYGERKDNE